MLDLVHIYHKIVHETVHHRHSSEIYLKSSGNIFNISFYIITKSFFLIQKIKNLVSYFGTHQLKVVFIFI